MKRWIFLVVFFVIAIWVGLSFFRNDAIRLTVVWRYQKPGNQLFDPSLSRDGSHLAFVQSLYWPDAPDQRPESLGMAKRYREYLKKDPRFADPQVLYVNPGRRIHFVDWGWTPSFSPTADAIFYVKQDKPLSGLRFLAENLRGNGLSVYNIQAQLKEHELKIGEGYYWEPRVYGSRVIFFLCDAVNGSFSSPIGVYETTIELAGVKSLLTPSRKNGRYAVVGKLKTFANQFYTIQLGSSASEPYPSELSVINLTRPNVAIGSLAIDSTTSINDIDFLVAANEKVTFFRGATVSPDQKLEARTVDRELRLESLDSSKKGRLKVGGDIITMAWSEDSKKLVIVVREYVSRELQIFGADTIMIINCEY